MDGSMMTDHLGEFAQHLVNKYSIAGELLSRLNGPDAHGKERRLRDLWDVSELSANDFADEVALFYDLPRVALAQLVTARSVADRFSARFLRETLVFPYDAGEYGYRLAVADPTDAAVIRAAEIVLGGPVAIDVASFEDIATVLSERGETEARTLEAAGDAALARSVDDRFPPGHHPDLLACDQLDTLFPTIPERAELIAMTGVSLADPALASGPCREIRCPSNFCRLWAIVLPISKR